MIFEILYEDDFLIAIDKPSGILVHRTDMSRDRIFILQELRNQINQHLYPVHRLDRPTSGVLLFAKNSEAAHHLAEQFKNHTIVKTYHAWVRGWFEKNGLCEYHLNDKEAQTEFQCFQQIELPIAQREFSTSRYSLVQAVPKTGRYHQIRLHLKHLMHPILGDTKHGDGMQNQIIREYFNEQEKWKRLLLHASSLEFDHPINNKRMLIQSKQNTLMNLFN